MMTYRGRELDHDSDVPEGRPAARQFAALIVIGAAAAFSVGMTLRMPSQLEANDISRWCTVWALLERGTYIIDECPWQGRTQDKVYRPAPADLGKPDAPRHFYSSKPPFLPTLIAGALYPFRKLTGVPLDAHVMQERVTRTVRKDDPAAPGDPARSKVVDETPPPVPWPVYVFYFKPVIVALNILPYLAFLVLFARLLDRHVRGDWAWFAGLTAAAWGTPLTVFNTTLNNHSPAAYAAFFAVYALMRIWEAPRGDDRVVDEAPPRPPYGAYASAGFFAAFAACNEMPAALFGILAFVAALARSPRATLAAFVPAAALPIVGFLATLYLATGGFKPVYAEFGTASYTGYEWSYWNTPLEMDWFDKHPEPWYVYLFHMTLGHHGIFSLTPVFLLAIPPMVRAMAGLGGDRRLSGVAWLTFVLTAGMLAVYTVKTHNYGGSTQGLRWLFWVFPLWLILVPAGFESGQDHKGMRRLGLACLALSVMSVGYGMRTPWSHPWILDLLEHFNLYTLTR